MWEIYSYGGGDTLYYVFNALALIMRDDYRYLVAFAGVLGILMVVFVGAFNQRNINLQWFLLYAFMIVVFLNNTVSVQIIDRIQPANNNRVDNVPFGAAVFASLVSTIGDRITRSFDVYFTLPGDVQYTSNGLIFGSRLMADMNEIRTLDAQTSVQLNTFLKDCTFYEIYEGNLTWTELTQSEDIWAVIGNNLNPARATPLNLFGGNGITLSCVLTYAILTNVLVTETQNSLEMLGLASYPGMLPGVALAQVQASLPSVVDYFTGISRSATDIIENQLVANQLNMAVRNVADYSGATATLTNYAIAQSDVNRKNLYAQLGYSAAKMLPLFKNLLEAFLYGVFPVIFIIMLLPRGEMVLGTYVKALLSVQLWTVLYAILNLILTVHGAKLTQDAAYDVTLGSAALNIGTYAGIKGVAQDMVLLAGYMSITIPVFAWSLVSGGAMAFTQLTSQLMNPSVTASTKAADVATTGNISLANTSINTHASNNVTRFQHNTAPSFRTHGLMMDDRHGNLHNYTDAGDVYTTKPGENLGQSAGIGAQDVSSISKRVGEAKSWEFNQRAAYARAVGSALDISGKSYTGMDFSSSEGFKNVHGYREGVKYVEDQSKLLGFNEKQTNAINDAMAASISAGFKLDKESGGLGGEAIKLINGFLSPVGLEVNAGGKITGTHENADSTQVGRSLDFKQALQTARENGFTSTEELHDDVTRLAKESDSGSIGVDLKFAEDARLSRDNAVARRQTAEKSLQHLRSLSKEEKADLTHTILTKAANSDDQNHRAMVDYIRHSSQGDERAMRYFSQLKEEYLPGVLQSLHGDDPLLNVEEKIKAQSDPIAGIGGKNDQKLVREQHDRDANGINIIPKNADKAAAIDALPAVTAAAAAIHPNTAKEILPNSKENPVINPGTVEAAIEAAGGRSNTEGNVNDGINSGKLKQDLNKRFVEQEEWKAQTEVRGLMGTQNNEQWQDFKAEKSGLFDEWRGNGERGDQEAGLPPANPLRRGEDKQNYYVEHE